MTKVISIVAVALAVAVVAAPAASESVRLALDQDRLTAGDLASLLPAWGKVEPEEMIAYAPLPGVERRVGPSRLIGWGRRFGVNLDRDELPDVLLITRRMRTFEPAEIEQRLREVVAEHYRVTPEAVDARLAGFEELSVPTGELTFRIAGSLPRLNQPTSVALRWREEGGPWRKRYGCGRRFRSSGATRLRRKRWKPRFRSGPRILSSARDPFQGILVNFSFHTKNLAGCL